MGLPTPRFIDSASYFRLDFAGHEVRLWVVPLFYWLLRYDSLRIAGQVVLAAAAWWVLASVAASLMIDRRARLGVRIALLILGLCGPIASWNSTFLSESVAISLTALLVAAWLYFSQAQSLRRAAVVIIATILWAFTRPDQTAMVAVIALLVLLAVVRSAHRGLSIVMAVVLGAIFALGVLTISRNSQERTLNLAMRLCRRRSCSVHSRTAWFVEHGMPYNLDRGPGRRCLPPDHRAGGRSRSSQWLRSCGRPYLPGVCLASTRWLLRAGDHCPTLSGEKASLQVPSPPANTPQVYPVASMLSPTANYGRHREVLPSVLQGLWFEQGQIGDVIVLAVLAVGVNVEGVAQNGPQTPPAGRPGTYRGSGSCPPLLRLADLRAPGAGPPGHGPGCCDSHRLVDRPGLWSRPIARTPTPPGAPRPTRSR